MPTDIIDSHAIPFVDFKTRYHKFHAEIQSSIESVLRSGEYILGNKVSEFENALGEYLECKHVITVANGTDAIILALKALHIGQNDEVIIPANSFIASAGAVVAVGAIPVFCDIETDLNIDPHHIEKCITKNTKAIMPVHLTGRPANMQAIMTIAEKHGLNVIEDAAQAIGSRYHGKVTGNFGDFGCFSLHPLKNLHVFGDGGFMTTNNTDLYHDIMMRRNHGLSDRNTCQFWGYNSRLDSIQAAIGIVFLKQLDSWTQRVREIAEMYRHHLEDIVTVPYDEKDTYPVYHNFVILTDDQTALMQFLNNQGIETKIHYPIPLHLQPAAKTLPYKKGDFPVTEMLSKKMVSLPINPELTNEDIQRIIHSIRSFYGK